MLIDTILLTKGLRAEFNKAFIEAPGPKYDPIVTRVPSTAQSETYGWLADVPQMREWLGEKKVKDISDYSYTIINKKYEATIGVDEDEIDDDQIGAIMPRVQMLAYRAKIYPQILISNLIAAGTTNLAYDGSAFFADRTAPNDNLLAGTGTTEAQIIVDIAAARGAMMKFADEAGEPLEIQGDVIVCPTALEIVFRRIVESSNYSAATAGGVVNFYKDAIKMVIVDARLSDANDWYLMASSLPLKPFILQTRKAPQFIALDKPESQDRFMRGKCLYSAEARYGAGYGYFQMAVKTVNT